MALRRSIVCAMLAVVLTSCAPSAASISTAIAQTQEALPTGTPVLTSTPSGAAIATAIAATQFTGAPGTAVFVAAHGACGTDAVLKAAGTFDELLGRWNDALDIAGSSARINLSGPVSKLQDLRREAQAVGVPDCMAYAKWLLIRSMDFAVNGYLYFMQQVNDTSVSDQLTQGADTTRQYTSEIKRIKLCAPNCQITPTPTPHPQS